MWAGVRVWLEMWEKVLKPMARAQMPLHVQAAQQVWQPTARAWVQLRALALAAQQVSTDDGEIRYEAFGPEEGRAIILLAADVNAFAAVSGPLAAQGFRVIVPHLRGQDEAAGRNASREYSPMRSVCSAVS